MCEIFKTINPWWPSCLDCGTLINVDAPGCGTICISQERWHKLGFSISFCIFLEHLYLGSLAILALLSLML